MLERIEFLTRQNGDLQQQISDAQEAHAVLQSGTSRLETQLSSQELTIQQVRSLTFENRFFDGRVRAHGR